MPWTFGAHPRIPPGSSEHPYTSSAPHALLHLALHTGPRGSQSLADSFARPLLGLHAFRAFGFPIPGGMVSSTVLTLVVLPAVYLIWRKWQVRKRWEATEG